MEFLAPIFDSVKDFVEVRSRDFAYIVGPKILDALELSFKVAILPFTIADDVAAAAPRGFGVPELASKLAFSTIFAVGTIGTLDLISEMGRKLACQRSCKACNGWSALRCSTCKGTGEVHFHVQNYNLRSGKATVENVAEAVASKHAELVHIPSSIDIPFPLPSKHCPSCDGTGIMTCPECRHHALKVRISVDNIIDSPRNAYNVLRKMDYPYENIVDSMRDPKIATFWLLTMPQIMGGFQFGEDIKQKIWWSYEESMRYDDIRDLVARRKPGWEHLQDVLCSLDPARAKNDPFIVRNVPYYKAKRALEKEVMKLVVPPRPDNWGTKGLTLPLSATSWSKEELKDPKKVLEMTTLLDVQREMADKLLDEQWEAKWRQEKLKQLLEEKMQSYTGNVDGQVLLEPVVLRAREERKVAPLQPRTRPRRKWWFF